MNIISGILNLLSLSVIKKQNVNHSSQVNFVVVKARLLCSDSKELLDMVVCFFDFQDSSESPNLLTKLVTHILV